MALVRRRRGAHLPRSAQQVRKQIPHTKSCVRRRDSLHRTRALLNKRGRIPSRRNRKEASQRHTNRADHPLRSRPRHRPPPPRESIRPRNAEKPKYTTSPYVSISSLKSGWKSDERPYQWAESISPLTISSACSLNL